MWWGLQNRLWQCALDCSVRLRVRTSSYRRVPPSREGPVRMTCKEQNLPISYLCVPYCVFRIVHGCPPGKILLPSSFRQTPPWNPSLLDMVGRFQVGTCTCTYLVERCQNGDGKERALKKLPGRYRTTHAFVPALLCLSNPLSHLF